MNSKRNGSSRRFGTDEAGAVTVLMITLMVPILVLGGLAMDLSQLIAARTQLQIAADLTAHAALYRRDFLPADEAKAAALEVAYETMPHEVFGETLTAENIQFGRWDPVAGSFTLDPASKTAVLVTTSRLAAKDNPVASFVLQLIGFSNFDLAAQSVFTTFSPACFREGFVAEGIVDLQSNNGFYNGFCVHSNTHVSLNQNNFFEPGTVVSMPDTGDLDLPQSGFEKNEGLQTALREGYYRMRLIQKLDIVIQELGQLGSEYQPAYIQGVAPTALNQSKLNPAMFTPGHIHRMVCNTGGTVTIEAGTYAKVVFVTNCKFKFNNGAALENAIFATTSTDVKSITAPNGLRLGVDDNCAAGGDAQLLTLGGVDVASSLQMYGAQIVARKTVQFAANADGIEGASIISGETISGTSNMSMSFCGAGMENNIEAPYFRLAY